MGENDMKEWTRKRKADIVMGIILQVYFLVPWIHHHTMYGYLYQALKMNDYVRTYNEMLLPSLKKIWGYTKPTAFVFLCILFLMLFFQIVEFMRLYHIFINERPSDYRGFFWILFMIAFAVFNDGFTYEDVTEYSLYPVYGEIYMILLLVLVGVWIILDALLDTWESEHAMLLTELKDIYASAERGEFVIEEGVEDVHSQVELMLTRRLGDVGKKIHSGRSRNDQVLLDLKLFTRTQIREVAEAVEQLFHVLIRQSERYKNVLMPGYTHLQIAMPSSFGLWFGAYAESLVDDMLFLQAAFKMCNKNPLGSAAGYGSSFPLNRTMTTELLGFDSLNYNVVYAQMGRGKMERNVAFALATLAGTISKLAFDACIFNSQNFGFVKLPDECTTGSSIMPHKKNPDVFELTRAKCNKLQSLPQQIMMIANNLPSGYFRDLQIIKEVFLPAFQELKDCLQMTTYIMNEIKVNEHILDDDKYLFIFSVEEVNRLAREGMPFRDAYKKVGLDIEAGHFSHDKQVHHTHEGSIGNLCNDEISALMQRTIEGFNFQGMEQAEKTLLGRK